MISLVAVSEKELAQTKRYQLLGVVGATKLVVFDSGNSLESCTVESKSLVREIKYARGGYPEYHGTRRKSCEKLGGPTPKAKYLLRPIVNQYREGKVKSTPGGE